MRTGTALTPLAPLALLTLLAACTSDPSLASTGATASATATPATSASVAPEARWLVDVEGDAARAARVAKHLRGLDVAMVEIGYRYGELYWAIRDESFDYASYQLGKIGTALGLGVERRPRREASARVFDVSMKGMRQAIDGRARAEAERAFAELTVACNACHAAEQVPFIRVAPPSSRTSVVQGPSRASP